MINIVLLVISIVVGSIGLIISFGGYKKDKTADNPQAVSKLSIKILVFSVVVIALNTIVVPLIDYFKPTEQLATRQDIELVVKLIKEKPLNPIKEEVEIELEREIKAALTKKKEEALAEYQRGNDAYHNNFYEVSITHFKNAIKIIKIPSFYLALGNSYSAISQYEPACRNYEKALKLCKESGDKQGEARALLGIGFIYGGKRDFNNALKYEQQALVIAKEIGYKRGEAGVLFSSGIIYARKGDFDNALKCFQQAKEIFIKTGDKSMAKTAQQAMRKFENKDKSN